MTFLKLTHHDWNPRECQDPAIHTSGGSFFCSCWQGLFLSWWKKVVLANGHEQNDHGQNDSTPGTEHGSKHSLDEAPKLQKFHQIGHHFGHHLGVRLWDLNTWRWGIMLAVGSGLATWGWNPAESPKPSRLVLHKHSFYSMFLPSKCLKVHMKIMKSIWKSSSSYYETLTWLWGRG